MAEKTPSFYGNLAGNASSADKVNSALTIGDKIYDGSQAITISKDEFSSEDKQTRTDLLTKDNTYIAESGNCYLPFYTEDGEGNFAVSVKDLLAQSITSSTGVVKSLGNGQFTTTDTIAKADKLSSAHTINGVAFDGSQDVVGAFINGLYEGNISWGGSNRVGDISPTDAGLINALGANRADFCNASGITIEYSTNGGSTWNDYGMSNDNRRKILSTLINSANCQIGSTVTTNATINDQLRITVNATTCGFYTALKKILIYVSTNGAIGSKVKIEQAYGSSLTTFITRGTYNLGGWSGWNSIPCHIDFGGGTSNVNVLRFTFSIEGLNSSYNSKLNVYNILFSGTTSWSYPSTMARTGHLYSYDINQNAFFPGQVISQVANDAYIKATNTTNNKYVAIDAYNDKTGVYINNGKEQWLINHDGSKVNILDNPYHQIYYGTSAPSSSLGSNGDVYIKYNA